MTMATDDYEEIEWSSYADVVLLNSLAGLRPVGANYHFCMTAVWQRFCGAMAKKVSLDSIEKRLEHFYDFEATNGIVDENGLFSMEQDFSLPESEFPEVVAISKERESSMRKNKTSSAAAESLKTPVSKTAKKVEPKTSEKPKRAATEEEKRTPATKRGRGSIKTTPTARRGRN